MLPSITRRSFFQTSAISASLLASHRLHANPLNLPIGLEMYTVGKDFETDPAGTLKKVAEAGYKDIELSPLQKVSPKEMRTMLDDAGLTNSAGHYMLQDLIKDAQPKIDFAKELGQKYMFTSVPFVADPGARSKKNPSDDQTAFFLDVLNNMTLDDWKWNAEQYNKIGGQIKKAGLEFGYHNHNFEFRPLGSTTGYDEFMRLTDPELVVFELDCGWVTVAGKSPIDYLHKHPGRYRTLHIKDFKKGFTPRTALVLGDKSPGAPVATQLGQGSIDYAPVFAAARKTKVKAYFVEQEPPFVDMPALEAMKVDFAYLKNLHG